VRHNNGMKLTGSAMSKRPRPPQLIPVFYGQAEVPERTDGPRERQAAQDPRGVNGCWLRGPLWPFRASRLLRRKGQEPCRPASNRGEASALEQHWSSRHIHTLCLVSLSQSGSCMSWSVRRGLLPGHGISCFTGVATALRGQHRAVLVRQRTALSSRSVASNKCVANSVALHFKNQRAVEQRDEADRARRKR
jgi:hypothetical protein